MQAGVNRTESSVLCTDDKQVRINFHFILRDDGTGNFTETGDGYGGSYNGFQRAQDIVNSGNHYWSNNQRQWLPNPNNTPTEPTRIQLVLMGTYFHRSTHWYNNAGNGNQYGTTLAALSSQFGVNTNSEINIFLIPEGDNSGVANCIGCANVNWTAMLFQDWSTYEVDPDWSIAYSGRILNHEVGHLFGLSHSWCCDDCDDTPINPNCWRSGDPDKPEECQGWENVSNNLMDYNQYQPALTPCQIGRMHTTLNGDSRYLICDTGCESADAQFIPYVEPAWDCNTNAVWVDGSFSSNETSYRFEVCEVPYYYSNEVIPNTCVTDSWFSGELGSYYLDFYTFYANRHYRIKLTVSNDCSESEQVNWISTNNLPWYCEYALRSSTMSGITMELAPNPSDGAVEIHIDSEKESVADLSLHDLQGNTLDRVFSKEALTKGKTVRKYKNLKLQSGHYIWKLQVGDEFLYKNWVIRK